jgi:hypothetical protein
VAQNALDVGFEVAMRSQVEEEAILREMFRPANYAEVSTWYRLTDNFRTLNEVSVPFRYVMPDQTDVLHHT